MLCLVGKIKDMISIEIGVPADKQELKGWVHRKSAITDKVIGNFNGIKILFQDNIKRTR